MIWCAGRYNDEDLPSTFFQSCITHPSFLDNSCSHLNENDLNVYKKEINSYYDDIVNSFLLADKHISKEIKRKNKKYKVILGWHEYVMNMPVIVISSGGSGGHLEMTYSIIICICRE